MSSKKPLNIGIVGYGFMGRTHANAYHNAANFFNTPLRPVLKAACGRDAAKVKAYADNWGFESTETDWKALVDRKDIDAIDICTPNDSHAEIAIAAAKAGKMVLCEKPLSLDGPQGEIMVKEIEAAKVPNTVWYNYRRVPAVTLAKQIIDSGKLGKIFHYRANFLQDWTISADLPQGGAGLWRLDAPPPAEPLTRINQRPYLAVRLCHAEAQARVFLCLAANVMVRCIERHPVIAVGGRHGAQVQITWAPLPFRL